jgi:hypothetical protein
MMHVSANQKAVSLNVHRYTAGHAEPDAQAGRRGRAAGRGHGAGAVAHLPGAHHRQASRRDESVVYARRRFF